MPLFLVTIPCIFAAYFKRTRSITGYLPTGRQGVPDYGLRCFTHMFLLIKRAKDMFGLSSNPEKRLKEHNSGKSKYTRAFKPWKLVYKEEFDSRVDARKREKYLKSGAGREFLDLILDP